MTKITLTIETDRPLAEADKLAESICRAFLQQGYRIRAESEERQEVFDYTLPDGRTLHFDVSRALRLIAERRRPIELVDVRPLFPMIDDTNHQHPAKIEVNWQEVHEHGERFDVSRPLLLAPFEGYSLLIDGWHRVARASLLGWDDLPAVVLRSGEVDLVLSITEAERS